MSIIIFIIVLLVLVLAHEFGHFIVAKKMGIRVDEFAFGFPPKLFGIKKGETTYSFNVLPLGGYVKIYGENPDDVTDDSDKNRSFTAKPRIVQGAVIVAGVIFNLLLAWILISGTLMIGITSPADEEGGYALTNSHVMVSGVKPESPADVAGLTYGDILLSVSDGALEEKTSSTDAVSTFVSGRESQPITFTYQRGGETSTLVVTPVAGIVEGAAAIGIYMDEVGTLKLPIHLVFTATGLWDFFSSALMGNSDFSQVTGPVGIVNAVGEAAGIGFANLLLFTALISINLAVINVIPFPALDGGRLLFIIIEAIIRRPINVKVANITNMIGFALLMLLMLAVTWNDVAKLL